MQGFTAQALLLLDTVQDILVHLGRILLLLTVHLLNMLAIPNNPVALLNRHLNLEAIRKLATPPPRPAIHKLATQVKLLIHPPARLLPLQ